MPSKRLLPYYATLTIIVLGRVHPQHRLSQAVPLAGAAAVLERGVHHVGLDLLVLKQALWQGSRG